MKNIKTLTFGVLLSALLTFVLGGVAFGVGKSYPTWGANYQRTANSDGHVDGQFYWLPTHEIPISGGYYSYSSPVKWGDLLLVYYYDDNNNGYLAAFSLSNALENKTESLWRIKFESGDISNPLACLEDVSKPFAHCGQAKGHTAPSIVSSGNKSYAAIGVGNRLYILSLSDGGGIVRAMDLINLRNPYRMNEVSSSPGWSEKMFFVGSWNGTFTGMDLASCVSGERCQLFSLNLLDLNLPDIITSSPSYDPVRDLVYFGTDPSGYLIAVKGDGGTFADGKRYKVLTTTRYGISSSIVVGPNGWLYLPDKKGWTYRFNPDTGAKYQAYCGTMGAQAGSLPSVIRNLAVSQHGVFMVTDMRQGFYRLPLDFTSQAQCQRVGGIVNQAQYTNPTLIGDLLLIGSQGLTFGDQSEMGVIAAYHPGTLEPKKIFTYDDGLRVEIGSRRNAVSDYQSPVVFDLGDGRHVIAMHFRNEILFWTEMDGLGLSMSIDGTGITNLRTNREHLLHVTVTNLSRENISNGVLTVDLQGSHVVFDDTRYIGSVQSGDCTISSSQTAVCASLRLGSAETSDNTKTFYLPIRTVTPGQQTFVAEAVNPDDQEGKQKANTSLMVNVSEPPPPAFPIGEFLDDPRITVYPPYPSTVKEQGRVRAELEYVFTGERNVGTDYARQGSQTCLREQRTEYTDPNSSEVLYEYIDIDGRPLIWFSGSRNVGQGTAVKKNDRIWTAPEVGFEQQGWGLIRFKVREDRKIRIERWQCTPQYESVYEDRVNPETGQIEHVKVGERFTGFLRSFVGTSIQDAQDIVREFKETIPVTAIGNIRGK